MSGIYIPDMEMPEKQVYVILNPNGLVEVLDANNVLLKEYQSVPVLEHGALMDRDDFFAICPELVDGYKCITDDLVVIPAEENE
jgi:hypothetical protein